MGISEVFVHTCDKCLFEVTSPSPIVEGWKFIHTGRKHEYVCPVCAQSQNEHAESLDKHEEV